jgi:hypothetical protein
VEGDALGTTTQVTVEDESGAPASDSAPTAIALSAPAAVSGGSQGGGPTTTGNPLARTGSDLLGLVDVALVAIGFGSLVLLRRRRLLRG